MSLYATLDDFVAQTGQQPNERTELLLSQASDAVDMAFASRGRKPPECPGSLLWRQCARVCVQLAQREMSDDGTGNVTQQSVTAGPLSQSWTFGDAGLNLKLRADDLKALGLYGGSFGFARQEGGDDACAWDSRRC